MRFELPNIRNMAHVPMLNMLSALEGSFKINAASVVPCRGRKTPPCPSGQIISHFVL